MEDLCCLVRLARLSEGGPRRGAWPQRGVSANGRGRRGRGHGLP